MTTYEAPMPAAAPTKKPGPSLRLSIILIVLAGVLVAIPSLIAAVIPIVDVFNTSGSFTAPDTVQMHLGKGDYLVYEDVGSAFNFGSADLTLDPQDVRVTGATGEVVETYSPSEGQSINNNRHRYEGTVGFKTPHSGEYTIVITSRGARTVLIARPVVDVLRSVIVWFALMGIGGLIFLTGVVLLIVGSVRRASAKKAYAFATAMAPAGWYPDAMGSGRLRYWDGFRWTEHLH